jgi:prophage regulatory protein
VTRVIIELQFVRSVGAMIETKWPEAESEGGTRDQLRQMLTEDEVLALLRISRTSLYRLEKAGKFPRGVYIAPNTKRWFRDQVIGWQAAIDEHDERDPNRRRGSRRPRVSPCAS